MRSCSRQPQTRRSTATGTWPSRGQRKRAPPASSTSSGSISPELLHMLAPEDLLRVEHVVRAADQTQTVHRRGAAQGDRMDVIEFQLPPAAAPPTVRARPTAAAAVAFPDRA